MMLLVALPSRPISLSARVSTVLCIVLGVVWLLCSVFDLGPFSHLTSDLIVHDGMQWRRAWVVNVCSTHISVALVETPRTEISRFMSAASGFHARISDEASYLGVIGWSDYHSGIGSMGAANRRRGRSPTTFPLTGSTSFSVRWWFLIVLAGLPLERRVFKRLLSKPQPDPGICLKCGYDLRASPDRCPECGMARTAPHNAPARNPADGAV
jgi:hypothetical protein